MMRPQALAALGLSVALLAFPGCWASEIRRISVDTDGLRAWAGQDDGFGAADSLIGSPALITTRIPELGTGDVQSIEEIGLYIQLQNSSFVPVEMAVYMHRRAVDRATLLVEGVRLTRPIVVQPQSALQIDGRNYDLYAAGFDEAVALMLGGDVHLYVASEASEFVINGNVPTLSLLVAIQR